MVSEQPSYSRCHDIQHHWYDMGPFGEAVYCAITALDRYPSHLDNIHYIWTVTLIYALPPSMNHAFHHFHPRHSSHPPFASSQHLLLPELSHLSHIIGSFVTGTSIMSVHQEAQPDPVVPSFRRQAERTTPVYAFYSRGHMI